MTTLVVDTTAVATNVLILALTLLSWLSASSDMMGREVVAEADMTVVVLASLHVGLMVEVLTFLHFGRCNNF